MSIGKIVEFDVENDNWTSYCERAAMFFIANAIPDDLRLPALIASIGGPTYDLLSNLIYPGNPSELTYDGIVAVLHDHFSAQPANFLAERCRFRQRQQNEGETVHQYIIALKNLAKSCAFRATLDENLLEQFVCGIRSDQIRQRLFQESKLTYEQAVAMASRLEAAERDAASVAASRTVQQDNQKPHSLTAAFETPVDPELCRACGFPHPTAGCRYQYSFCNNCRRRGHLQRVCKEVSVVSATRVGRPRVRRHFGDGGRRWKISGRVNGEIELSDTD